MDTAEDIEALARAMDEDFNADWREYEATERARAKANLILLELFRAGWVLVKR